MSQLKTTRVQIGQSATPEQNFVLQVPDVPDGTLRIMRGVLGGTLTEVGRINAQGFYEDAVPRQWQDVTASRVIGTTYTNNTGREIEVAIGFSQASGVVNAKVGGVTVYDASGSTSGERDSSTFTVPAGGTYVLTVSASNTIYFWSELR